MDQDDIANARRRYAIRFMQSFSVQMPRGFHICWKFGGNDSFKRLTRTAEPLG